ncbi:hypothetical protein [Nisaea sediminum]|uniref:hypothetical protein n=1 Tax=Nisaea sediminum TaxID=2775867 RepID=UPI0018687ED2|nr:hypothetical protein [Nisaea sediminum]
MARGGYRPGAGRPKGSRTSPEKKAAKKAKSTKPNKPSEKPTAAPETEATDEQLMPVDYLIKVINDPSANADQKMRAAIAAAPFVHTRTADNKPGKKQQAADRANAASSSGRFAVPAGPPGLRKVVDNTG